MLAGAAATVSVFEAAGAGWMLRSPWELVGHGVVGFALILAGPLFATLTASSRSAVRAGAALGMLAPVATLVWWERASNPAGLVAWGAIAVPSLALAWQALRRSAEPAAWRLLVSAAGASALCLGAIATVLWWPEQYSLASEPSRRLPTPHIVLAAVLLGMSLHQFARRRGASLVTLAGAAVCIASAPHLGGFTRGCIGMPGPIELLLVPSWIAPAVLLLWARPVIRFCRHERETSEPVPARS